LIANPFAERLALHWFGANLQRNVPQELPGKFEVLKRVLPTLRIRAFGRTAFARQAPILFQSDILSHPLFLCSLSFIVPFGKPLKKVSNVATGREYATDEFEVGDCRRVNIEDGKAFRVP